jgi:hypothetical protein
VHSDLLRMAISGRGCFSVQDGCLKLANFKHSPWTCWVNVRNSKISQINQKVKENTLLLWP